MSDFEILQGLNAWKTKNPTPTTDLYILLYETVMEDSVVGVFKNYEKLQYAVTTLDSKARTKITIRQVQEKVGDQLYVVFLCTNFCGDANELIEFLSFDRKKIDQFVSSYKHSEEKIFNPRLRVGVYQLDKVYKYTEHIDDAIV